MAERGLFIQVEVDDKCTHSNGCRVCVDACPVDIFSPNVSGAAVGVTGAAEDECILCNLCVDQCPQRSIQIIKLYEPREG